MLYMSLIYFCAFIMNISLQCVSLNKLCSYKTITQCSSMQCMIDASNYKCVHCKYKRLFVMFTAIETLSKTSIYTCVVVC